MQSIQLEIETTKEVSKKSLNIFACPFDRNNASEYSIVDITFLVNEKINADLMLEFLPCVEIHEIKKEDWVASADVDYAYEYEWKVNCGEKINSAVIVPKTTDPLNLDDPMQQMNDVLKYMKACVSLGVKDGFVVASKIKCIWDLHM